MADAWIYVSSMITVSWDVIQSGCATSKLKGEVDGEENKLLLKHPGLMWLDFLEGVDGDVYLEDWLFFFFSPWTTIITGIHWNYCDCTLSASHTTFHLNQNGQLPIKPVHFAPGFRECTQLQCNKGLMDANELALPLSRHVTPVWHCNSLVAMVPDIERFLLQVRMPVVLANCLPCSRDLKAVTYLLSRTISSQSATDS